MMARERATDTRALVRAAATAFEEKGYRNTTIDDIAEAAGISRPTVYKYTGSKRELLDQTVDEITSYLGARLREVLDGDREPVAKLRAVIAVHVQAAVTNRTFYAIVFSEETELSAGARRKFRAWAREVTDDFARLLDECRTGRPGGADIQIAANLILTMLTSLHRWYRPGGRVGPAELTGQILRVADGLLAADPPATAHATLGCCS
jgi:AcrR family transcriptional regulator